MIIKSYAMLVYFIGIGNSLIFGPTIICVGRYFSKRRGLANGLVMSGGSLGSLVLPLLLQYLLDEYGLTGTLIVIAGITLNNFVVAALLRPPSLYEELQIPVECESLKMKTVTRLNGIRERSEGEEKPFLGNGSSIKNIDPVEIGSGLDLVNTNSNPNVYELQSNILCASLVSLPVSHVSENVYASKQSFRDIENIEEEELEKGIFNAIKRTAISFVKHDILRNPLLYIAIQGGILICPSGALVGIYLPPHSRDLKIEESDVALLLSIIGGMDFIGRVSYALLSELRCIQRYQLLAITSILAGVLTHSIRLFTNFQSLCVFAALYGIIGGAYYVLYTSVLVDFMGMNQLRFSLGILSVTQGLSFSAYLPCLGM